MAELMRSLGLCVGMVLTVAAAGGAGCQTRGTLTGAGGMGTLSGAGGSGGAHTVFLGTAGAGPIFTGSAGSNGLDVCGRIFVAERAQEKIMLLLDSSDSMNEGIDGTCTRGCAGRSKWSAAMGGIDAVLGSNPPFVQWGLEMIGSADHSCTAGGIEIGVAQGTADAIVLALSQRTSAAELAVTGIRPTRAAVNAARIHLDAQTTSPGFAAIVLMTDGLPNCDQDHPYASDVAGTVEAITAARTLGIPTFVIGIGIRDADTGDGLSMMAVQGGALPGGAPANYNATSAGDVADALNEAVAVTGACTFVIPPPPSDDGLTSREGIHVFADGTQIPQDANDGWTYADNTHTTFTLHGRSCDAVDAGATVSLEFRCPLL